MRTRNQRRTALALPWLVLLVAACSSSGASVSASASNVPAPVQATDVEGRYELMFTLPRDTWRSGESIEGEARLSLSDGPAETLYGSGTGMLAFSFREVTGTRSVVPAVTADCAPHPIAPDAPIVTPIVKSGGWAEGEPNADFVRSFLNGPGIRLPAGDWDIVVTARFDDGETCTASPRSLEAGVRIRVTD